MRPDQLPYRTITRERFLPRETRICARLMNDEGLSAEEVPSRVASGDLFHYPTERMVANIASVCARRLAAAPDPRLVGIVAHGTPDEATHAALYVMARSCRLVYEFLVQVVGAKLAALDTSVSRADVSAFLTHLREASDTVGSWSDATIYRTRSELWLLLAQAGYIETGRVAPKAQVDLSPISISLELERIVRAQGDAPLMPAFGGRP